MSAQEPEPLPPSSGLVDPGELVAAQERLPQRRLGDHEGETLARWKGVVPELSTESVQGVWYFEMRLQVSQRFVNAGSKAYGKNIGYTALLLAVIRHFNKLVESHASPASMVRQSRAR